MKRSYVLFPILIAWLVAVPGIAKAEPDITVQPPLQGAVVGQFSVGANNWDAGHRGVDLAASVGQPVYASADGIVRYSGQVVDRGVVSLDHGTIRTTYEPLVPTVAAGARVRTGDLIGYLSPGHTGCAAAACLHWGMTDGERYYDPLNHLEPVRVRLFPAGTVRQSALAGYQSLAGPRTATSPLIWPAQGRPGSPFGMRLHPILGYYRMHWGTDIGAACGSPLFAAGDGSVRERSSGSGYGNYLVLDLGTVGGARIAVGYAHAASYTVAVGQRVTKGQVIGYVGTTGLSTGCHLHLELWRNGGRVDPMTMF